LLVETKNDMSLRKMPFISSVKMAKIDGSYVIPTSLYYEGTKPRIGTEARDKCPSPDLLVEDFKIELGTVDPDEAPRRTQSNSPRRTTLGLAKDFFDASLEKINQWLEAQDLALPTRILIAEPLALAGTNTASEAWLSNYRKAVRKALYGKFQEIDFMPEPFAVFQYYRYGLRHWTVAEHKKHVALVLDFGGGTFDVCVVETTKTGDISGSGTNSRPLAAKSVQIGGFAINRLIAEDLLFPALAARVEKSEVRKALTFLYANKNADEEFLDTLSEKQRAFFKNIKAYLQAVERAKLSICRSIANWNISADLSGVLSYALSVPTDPFSSNTQLASVRLDAARLRSIFERQIWSEKLRNAVQNTIERGRAEISGQEITVVLLSGGSSNIRWLKPLIERDLRASLGDAQVVELSEDFQEVVAKGLATECARRFFNEGQGDFGGVTYNRLCLLLRPDEGEVERRRFRPTDETLKKKFPEGHEFEEAILLPAASSLRGLIDQPLRWKVRLSKPPKHALHYYFMRSSFDHEDLDSRHNIVDTRAQTPPGAQFQQSIEVELTVHENGTALPRFIYGRDDRREGTVVDGRPFYMDMTVVGPETKGETYLGFDFGTSTSACSFVSSRDIQMIEQRGRQAEWRDLAELVTELPYPAAAALARFMSETDEKHRVHRGRSAVEAMLTLAAYVTICDHCVHNALSSSYLKGLQHRSAGPLWGLLKAALQNSPRKWAFAAPLLRIMEGGTVQQIDAWISEIANVKHDRKSNIDYVTFLSILGNHLSKIFASARFGVFEGVTAKRFAAGQFRGLFRSLAGSSRTFINVIEYEGTVPFSDAEVFVIDTNNGAALPLSPLYWWGLAPSHNSEPDLYEFDTMKGDDFVYRSIQAGDELRVSGGGEFSEIHSQLRRMKEKDRPVKLIEGLVFSTGEGS